MLSINSVIAPISVSSKYIQDMTEEYCEKLEKHIDELEEDIAFLNDTRLAQIKEIEELRHDINQLQINLAMMKDENADLNRRLSNIECIVGDLISKEHN